MGPFLPLFSVEVEHAYFPGGICHGLHLVASGDTLRRIDRSGCLLRHTDRGLIVAFDASAANALRLHAGDVDEPLRFDFLARVADGSFANYTEGHIGSDQAVLLLDNRNAVPDGASGLLRLHAGTSVGVDDAKPLASAAVTQVLSPRDRRSPPHFALSVSVDTAHVTEAESHAPRRYLCRLQARATVWKYLLFGEFTEAQEDVQIVDLGEACEFDEAVRERLPDGRSVMAVRSRTPITLQQRSERRFQLRRRGTGADKVLIKRLPVASPSLISRETLRGVPMLVSEIYVHR